MQNSELMDILEVAKGLAAVGSEAATNWEQAHLATLFIEIERKLTRAMKIGEDIPPI